MLPQTQRETGPVAHIPSEPVELPSPTYANPFDDENEHHPQPVEPFQPTTERQMQGLFISSAPPPPQSSALQPPSPGRARLVDIPPPVRRKEVSGSTGSTGAGSPSSYHPGFSTTQSYVKRQESAVGGLTMHGAVIEEGEDDDGRGAGRGTVRDV